jgi:hypothetical protein
MATRRRNLLIVNHPLLDSRFDDAIQSMNARRCSETHFFPKQILLLVNHLFLASRFDDAIQSTNARRCSETDS